MGGIEIIPASVVIPVHNEDDTLGIVKKELNKNQPDISECALVIEAMPGVYPGEGRNRGIKIS